MGWCNPGKEYGFIEVSGGEDVLAPWSGMRTEGYTALDAGEEVEFEVAEDDYGALAARVRRVAGRTEETQPRRTIPH